MHLDHLLIAMRTLVKFTLMDWLLCMVILVGIYGHILLGMMTIQLDLTTVHVTMVAHNQFLLMLEMTTTVKLEEIHAVELIPMIHCGMDSSVMVWRLPAVLASTCRGSSRHSVRPRLTTLN